MQEWSVGQHLFRELSIKDQLDELLNPSSFIGRAPEQVDKFLAEWVRPALDDRELKEVLAKGERAELSVWQERYWS